MKESNIKNEDVGDMSAPRNRAPLRPAGSQDKESYMSPASRMQGSPKTVIQKQMGIPESLTGDTPQQYKTDDKVLPFDICKARIGGIIKLKKSLLEMKREERKESKRAKNGPQNVYLRPGMVLLKRFITHQNQDKDESEESCRKGLPVVSFSLGDSAEFLYGDDRNVDNASKVVLESGDVLIFGGESRLIFHGIQSICSGTSPNLLIEETGMHHGRLNLTFRKY